MTTKICEFPGCLKHAVERGHCHRHYEKLTRLGYLPIIARPIDSTEVRARITEHLDRGRTLNHLAVSAGVHYTALRLVYTTGSRIRMTTAAKVIAVPLPPSSVGIRRRLEALERIGYRLSVFARSSGIPVDTLRGALNRGDITIGLRMRICAGYEKLSASPLDEPTTIARAVEKGFYAPAAWEYIDIDDPDSCPDLLGLSDPEVYADLPERKCIELLVAGEYYDLVTDEPPRAAMITTVDLLTKRGWDARRIAEWLRVTSRTVIRMRAEARGERVFRQRPAEACCRSTERHPFTPENTRVDSQGKRHCRICERRYKKAQRTRAREIAA